MKAVSCPNCSKPTEFKFFERRMVANKAKPCNNCGVLLSSSKKEAWATFTFIFLTVPLGIYLFDQAGFVIATLSFLMLALMYHLLLEFLPLKIKSQNK